MKDVTILTAVYDRLVGADDHGQPLSLDGTPVEVYVRGDTPTGLPKPCVIIEMPRSFGSETLDGRDASDIRFAIRVHDRFSGPVGPARLRPLHLAHAVHDHLTADTLPLSFGRPNLLPQPPYDSQGETAWDVLLQYDLLF
jgi:hypothetical protein